MMRTVIEGLSISYKFTGEGEENVCLLQGWGTSCSLYDIVAALFDPSSTRFLQFDMPGFGDSEEPPEPWNVERYALFFCSLMKELGIKRTALIGHSFGGRVIIRLAAMESLPFEITKIVLMDSAGVAPVRTLKQKLKIRQYRILKRIFAVKIIYALFPELVDDWRMRQGSEDYRRATPIMRQCLVMSVNEDLTPLLPLIKKETLLIWGDKDMATPIRDAHIMEKMIPNAGLAVIEGAGHFPFLDDPLRFAGIIRAYFR